MPDRPATVHVAVAASFAVPFAEIAAAFEHETGTAVEASRGSTGQLYAQIVHGAPHDVFLAADAERPARLEAQGRAVPGSRFPYARGRLALWRPSGGDPREALAAGDFRHLAMANPKTAPYGEAARQVLARLGLLAAIEGRIVLGEDVGQAYQFVATGNAELGFVARSQLAPTSRPASAAPPGSADPADIAARPGGEAPAGAVWNVPESLHDPIEQHAVLVRDTPAARALLRFLRGPAAARVLERYGYAPADAPPPVESAPAPPAGRRPVAPRAQVDG